MATSYPGGIDSPTDPTPTSPTNSPSHAGLHDFANDAIVAIETALGTTGAFNFVKVGATAGGDLTGTLPSPTLAAIGSATGPVGDGTHVPVVTIDAKGRVTALTSTAVSGGAPSGSAGGDLTGTYPNPGVAQIQGVAVTVNNATLLSQVVAPVSRAATATAAAGEQSVISGSSAGQTLTMHNTPATGTVNSIINNSTQNWTIAAGASDAINTFGVVGSITLAPGQGVQMVYLLTSNTWFVMDFTIHNVGGDLSGTLPNPTVTHVQGVAVSSNAAGLLGTLGANVNRTTSATVGQGETTLFTGSTAGQTLTLPSSGSNSGSVQTVMNLNTTSVTVAAGSGTTINNLGVGGSVVLAANQGLQLVLSGSVWYVIDFFYEAAGGDLAGTFPNPTLAATPNVLNVVQATAWQNVQRRGGNIGVATSTDASSSFPYGQIEVVMGDSIAAGAGTSGGNFGKTDWPSILANSENRILGLPDAGIGYVDAGGGGGVYGLPQFSTIGASLTAVQGVGADNGGVQLTGTLNSLTATNSLTDNRVFNRALIFYKPVANADGIGVSLTGGGGAVTHTIDATAIATGGNSTVAFYDTGAVASPSVAPVLSLTRATHVSGSGGVAPTVYGVLYFGPGVPGTSGLSIVNIGAGGTGTPDWVLLRVWESLLGALGTNVRRVHIRLGGNDTILARNLTDAVFNGTTTITSATGFVNGDVGRPVTGNANVQAGTTIISTAGTSAVLSLPTTGGNLSSQTITLGQIPPATTAANLNTIISRARAQVPLAEIALSGEYQAYSPALALQGYINVHTFATTIVPMYQQVAVANNCSYVDMYSRFGSVAALTITDAGGMANSSQNFTSTSQAQFCQEDIGALITGTNIQAGTTIQSVTNATTIVLSKTATGTASGNYTINHDVYGLTIDNLHFGDYTNSTGKVDGQRAAADEITERLGYALSQLAPFQGIVTLTTGSNWLCPATGTYLVTCVAAGGQGGGGGSASTGIAQQGGGGGALGGTTSTLLQLTAGVLYPFTIGAGGTGSGAGGAAGGHNGSAGANGGNTSFGTGPLLLATGGGAGQPGQANGIASSLNYALPASNGATTTSGTLPIPGCGGGFIGTLFATIGIGPGGGGTGGSSNTTNGGNGGPAGTVATLTPVGSGQTGTAAGGNGSNAVAPNYGCGGGGGGGGTNNTGAGGTGGNGAPGVIYIQRVL